MRFRELKSVLINLNLILFLIILTTSFVIAAVIIFNPGEKTIWSVNEDISFRYNVSVNVTDLGSVANVTQVNITLPPSFSFAGTSNWTSALPTTFVNTSSVLSWTNRTALVNGSGITNVTGYFLFNATPSTPGTYNLSITITNGSGSFSQNLTISVNDTTPPNVTIVYPSNNSLITSSSISFNLTVLDNNRTGTCWYTLNGGVANSSMVNTTVTVWNATNTSIADKTNYLVQFYCNDSAGNTNNSEHVSFTIDAIATPVTATEESGGSSGTPSIWKMTYILDDEQFVQGYTKAIKINERTRVKVKNVKHHIGITKITQSEVTLEIASTPQTAVLAIGEEKRFEVDDDNYYDIYIKLIGIENNKANLTIKSISEEISSEDVKENIGEESEEKTEEALEKKNLTWLGIVIVFIIITLIGVGHYFMKKKKNS